MSLDAADFGDLEDVLKALGFAGDSGALNEDWLADPITYLKTMLANETQREALLAVMDRLLEGETEIDGEGHQWLPVVASDDGAATFYFVIDDEPETEVHIGLGVRLKTTDPDTATSFFVPLFRAAKEGHSVPDPVLIGHPGGKLILASEIVVDPNPPSGEAGLRSIGLAFTTPTAAGDGDPAVALTLGGLFLPGFSAPRDFSLSVSDLDTLDESALELILGIIQAMADGGATPEITALAGLLGLAGSVPPLPIDGLVNQGPQVLADWFAALMGDSAAKSAWLQAAANLIGGAASLSGDTLAIDLGGGVSVDLVIGVVTGSTGRPVVTPSISFGITQGSARVEVAADLLKLDLGTGAAVAVPALSAQVRLGNSGAPLLVGDPGIEALRAGIALGPLRQPIAILALDQVVIAGNSYEVLDLSTPDAIAEAGTTVIGDVIADLLAQLGPPGTAISVLLGIAPPAGAPGLPTLDLSAFLADPLAAVRNHWLGLLGSHVGDIPEVLGALRGLLADAAVAADPVTGNGTIDTPWRVGITGPVALLIRQPDPGVIELAVGLSATQSELGERCTVLETSIDILIMRADLAAPDAAFAANVTLTIDARGRGTRRTALGDDPLAIAADRVSARFGWSATEGLSVNFAAPNPALIVREIEIPLDIPNFDQGFDALTPQQWDAIEELIGLLGASIAAPWALDILTAIGWRRAGVLAENTAINRLALSDLIADPDAALRAWLGRLISDPGGSLRKVLEPLGRVMSGSRERFGVLSGRGAPDDPLRMNLAPDLGGPALGLWTMPGRAVQGDGQVQSEALRQWRPGDAPLDTASLAAGIVVELASREGLVQASARIAALAAGIDALEARLSGTDGLIVPPDVLPDGATRHEIPNVAGPGLREAVDLEAIFGNLPGTILHLAVANEADAFPFDAAPEDRRIDLRPAGRAPDTFEAPTAAPGEWFIALGPRADVALLSGDPDGTGGQTARLARMFAAFSTVGGDVAVVADAAGAHAAWLAAENVGAGSVNRLLTLGMPLVPAAFSIFDLNPGAEALRTFLGLLPPEDPGTPDDDALGFARAAFGALSGLSRFADPAAELSPPANLPGTVAAGLNLHCVYGIFDRAAIRAGLTAAAAAGLSERASVQAGFEASATVTGAGFGLLLPITPASGGLTVSGHVAVELGAIALDPLPSLTDERSVRLHLEIRRDGGWLLGGPGSGAGAAQELRWIAVDIAVPLGASGPVEAEIRLHDAVVFGLARDVWVLREAGADAAEGVVTTALPEVRVLLSSVVTEILSDPSPEMGALADLLSAIGVIDDLGGLVATALDRVLHEPDAQVRDALLSAARVLDLQGAADTIFAGIPGLSIDIAARSVSFSLAGSAPSLGLPNWSVSASAASSGPITADLSIGAASSGALTASLDPLEIRLDWTPPGAAPVSLPIWPNADPAALAQEGAPLTIASAVKFGVDYMRSQDDGAKLIIDGLLELLGLLAAPGPDGDRAMVTPIGLFRDPVAWLKSDAVFGLAGGYDASRVGAAFDALRPFLGLSGAPGRWDVADGVAIELTGAGGVLDLGLALDSDAIGGGAEQLAFGGRFGLLISDTAPVAPNIAVFAGLPSAIQGRSAVHLNISAEVSLFLRNASGTDLPLYPNTPGLASLAGAAVETALPLALNALVDAGGTAGDVVAAVGDALVLREGTPLEFTGPRLSAWANDPEGELAARWPAITTGALNALANALAPVLPVGVSASSSAAGLDIIAGPITLSLETGPFRFAIGYSDTGLPFVETVTTAMAFDAGGLDEFTGSIGPALIDAGGASLFPVVSFEVGENITVPFVGLGLAIAGDGVQVLTLRTILDPLGFEVVFDDGDGPVSDPASVASGLLTLTVGLVVDFLRQTDPVQDLLETEIPGTGSSDIEDLLEGVILLDGDTSQLDLALFQLIPTPGQSASDIRDNFIARMIRLIENFADAGPSVTIDSILTVGLARDGNAIGVNVGLTSRLPLTSGDVVVSIENDSRWIKDAPPAGIVIGLVETSPTLGFAPSIAANGLGVRIGKDGAPLVDFGLSLGSIALHLFGRIGNGPPAGGVQVQLSDLAVSVSGGTGGNPVAQGIMDESSDSGQELAPMFSPALAIQKHGSDPVMVRLSAGEGDGPWWLSIKKGFGPLYVDQVGLGVTQTGEELEKISLLFDGNISIAGLTAAVDDLQLTYSLDAGPVYDPGSWSVDLSGLAVSADLSGVQLAGGLRKYSDPGNPENVEYVGMLLARFAAYGLSIYGGYASIEENDEGRYTAFFAYGAIVGPIGGPPAFFLTGIGGGFGINREIVVPDDLSKFDEFVMIKALDPSASAPSDPMAEMDSVRVTFPPRKGTFWFAAGISYTSFMIVDGVAVVAVEFGNGFELNIFGLARMALPRPQFRLVSIEIALVARFSTEEGVIWIQAQLTDNSWLLHESVRLTGGFAYVSWFGGPKKGEFVLTFGGYHPKFHRDGYPVVPRLGFHWQPTSNIVIKGGNYFALTSEAIMAGGGLEASATLGPAWAYVAYGCDVIIYFDPFRYEAEAYAKISAGVTIDVWIGKITIKISLGASIYVEGPEFRGEARFKVGPVKLKVKFGASSQSSPNYITWTDFVVKYLEEARPGTARALSAIAGNGALPPGGEEGTADGSIDHPFEVMSEFEMTVTTTLPADRLVVGTASPQNYSTLPLGLPPINASLDGSELSLSLIRVDTDAERINETGVTVLGRYTGKFPMAVWGPPQELDKKSMPKGEVLDALEGAHMTVKPSRIGRLPPEIAFNQVEAGPRKPLPFVTEATVRPGFLADIGGLVATVPGGLDPNEIFELEQNILAQNGLGKAALAGRANARVAPGRIGSLGERLAVPEAATLGNVLSAAPVKELDLSVKPPRAAAILSPEIRAEAAPRITTVRNTDQIQRVAAPSLAQMRAGLPSQLPAVLTRVDTAARGQKTVIAGTRPPVTQSARANASFVAGLGQDGAAAERLAAFDQVATGPARRAATDSALLTPGEIAIFDMPAARRSDPRLGAGTITTSGGAARVTAIGLGGAVLDTGKSERGRVSLPGRTSRIIIEALGDGGAKGGVTGWMAEQELAFVGWSRAIFAGGSVHAAGAQIGRRNEAAGLGWINAAKLTRQGRITTRFETFQPLLVLLLEGPVNPDAARDFALALTGAKETAAAPVVVNLGARTALILETTAVGKGGPVSVGVESKAPGRLAGVMLANGTADRFAELLGTRSLEELLDRPRAVGGKPVKIAWKKPPNKLKEAC
ncbi:hypothetical protein SAMN05444851_1543 [Aliiroseovarius sediminilitoris]|uniref:DUF6603 domain-containing protein n=1 Tax=Aliiroseovarius sediminilitoris TaxID=1173584 RepID=A0A1I0PCK8_9RHOB|nr:DUF6603 domain-containing protein [Aliiroseovarius sediminilitoris]SEW12092.1 hypothetical protein SAMN05444851_1543 [Aliiroseovarius sediminilitoris]